MISTLLRLSVLTAITFAAATLILLPTSRIAVAMGWAEVHDAFCVLRVSGGVAIFSSLIGIALWHRDV